MKFKFIEDLTSDVMFEAYGNDLKELFENSATALFNVICKIDKVKTIKSLNVEIEGDNLKELLINWLQELIALVDIKEMFFSKFEILEVSEKRLKAKIYGEKISPEKGETVVKAVTYHNFKLEKNKKGYLVRVVFDI